MSVNEEKQLADLPVELIVSGTVLTLDADDRIVENGAVAVAGDTIVAVDEADSLSSRYPAAARLCCRKGLVMPGLINSHTHAAMACFRGLADDLPLMTWLQKYIFPVEGRLNGATVYQAALLSMAEMIKSGTTSFCDMYLFAGDVARAAEQAGMRAWIGEVLYDFPSPNYGALENGFRYMEELFDRYAGHPLISITVDPHAVYTCSPDLLCRLKKVAERRAVPYVIHLSETRDEVEGALRQFGCTPVQHLDRLGILDCQVIADHCVMLTEAEMDLLAVREVRVAHCPESNMKLASGVAPVPQLLGRGVTVGLGTDGSASNNDVDLFGEMDSAAKLHKVFALDPTVMSASQTLALATRGGAGLLGAGDRLGAIEVGRKADLIVIDLDQPHLIPMYNIASHLVYAVRGSDVMHSVINGRVVMRDRKLLTIDEASLGAAISEIAAEIRTRLADQPVAVGTE